MTPRPSQAKLLHRERLPALVVGGTSRRDSCISTWLSDPELEHRAESLPPICGTVRAGPVAPNLGQHRTNAVSDETTTYLDVTVPVVLRLGVRSFAPDEQWGDWVSNSVVLILAYLSGDGDLWLRSDVLPIAKRSVSPPPSVSLRRYALRSAGSA